MKSASRAEVADNGRVWVHASREDTEELEKMKVLRMPEEFFTRYQRARRDELLASERSTD